MRHSASPIVLGLIIAMSISLVLGDTTATILLDEVEHSDIVPL
ncbi:MAG: hypothetical protein WEC79_06900 [Thermomicrobiales bacterium]